MLDLECLDFRQEIGMHDAENDLSEVMQKAAHVSVFGDDAVVQEVSGEIVGIERGFVGMFPQCFLFLGRTAEDLDGSDRKEKVFDSADADHLYRFGNARAFFCERESRGIDEFQEIGRQRDVVADERRDGG